MSKTKFRTSQEVLHEIHWRSKLLSDIKDFRSLGELQVETALKELKILQGLLEEAESAIISELP